MWTVSPILDFSTKRIRGFCFSKAKPVPGAALVSSLVDEDLNEVASKPNGWVWKTVSNGTYILEIDPPIEQVFQDYFRQANNRFQDAGERLFYEDEHEFIMAQYGFEDGDRVEALCGRYLGALERGLEELGR